MKKITWAAVLSLLLSAPKPNKAMVAVCQAGYSVGQIKHAVVVVPDSSTMDTVYAIVKASTGKVVKTGRLNGPYHPEGWTRGETYYWIDFSNFKNKGEYKITSNGDTSASFTINGNVWTAYTDEVVEFYRYQRCGTDTRILFPDGFKNRPADEALHAPCHADDAKLPGTDGKSADMTGGWHDAGDNNKYQSNTGWVTGALAISFLRHPKAAFDFDKNRVPDLLDEARWGAENLLKIQAAAGDGSLFDNIDPPKKRYYTWTYPPEETDGVRGTEDDREAHTRGVNGAKTPVTFDATIKTSGGLAAVARAFAARDREFSERCRRGAVSAYQWCLNNTDKTGGNYSIGDQKKAQIWAAVQLFLLTGGREYKDWIEAYLKNVTDLGNNGTNYWGLEPIALAEYYPLAGAFQEKIVALLETHADSWIKGLIKPFGVGSSLVGAKFGVNEPNLSYAADSYRLYEMTGNTRYRDAAVAAIQWTFGVNPFNVSWVAGIGTYSLIHPHARLDRDAANNAQSTLYLPGAMACGANWTDTQNPKSKTPWYEDRALALDGSQQWRYNEYSISIQFGLVDLVVAMAYGK